jgi:hypothetical protein
MMDRLWAKNLKIIESESLSQLCGRRTVDLASDSESVMQHVLPPAAGSEPSAAGEPSAEPKPFGSGKALEELKIRLASTRSPSHWHGAAGCSDSSRPGSRCQAAGAARRRQAEY